MKACIVVNKNSTSEQNPRSYLMMIYMKRPAQKSEKECSLWCRVSETTKEGREGLPKT